MEILDIKFIEVPINVNKLDHMLSSIAKNFKNDDFFLITHEDVRDLLNKIIDVPYIVEFRNTFEVHINFVQNLNSVNKGIDTIIS